ncbi:MAG: hypothetical protein HY680_08360 [Chloroflexi bacterium]|nr:hypothetical protein [Chloroflexota bacterium]
MTQFKRTMLLVGLALVAAAAVMGCSSTPAVPVVSLAASDYGFSAPASVPGGLTRLSMTNKGKEDHHAQLLRLNDGVTQAQFQSTLQDALKAVPQEGEAALFRIFGIVTFTGGPSTAMPGKTNEALANLATGEYVLVCFIAGQDGVPHLAKGMVQPLTVTAAPAKAPAAPASAATVKLNDFAFVGAPATLSKGKSTIKVENSGKEPHEMAVFRLKGINAGQLREILTAPPGGAAPSGPPPFESAGGYQAIMPGMSGWATLDLEPGNYALVCFVPSPAKEGAPHVALGMLSSFAVS